MRGAFILAVILYRVLGSAITTDIVTGDDLVAIDVSRAGLYIFGKKPFNWVTAIEDRGRLEVSASHSKTCLFSVIQPRFRASYQLRAEPFQKLPWDMNAEAEVELETVATFLLLMPTKEKVMHCDYWMRLVGLKTAMRIAEFDEWMVTPRNPQYAVVKFTVISEDSQRSDYETLGVASLDSQPNLQIRESPAALTTLSTSRTPRVANTMSSLSRLVTPRSADSLKPPLQNPRNTGNTSSTSSTSTGNTGGTRDRLPSSQLGTPRSADSLKSTFRMSSNVNYYHDSLEEAPELKPIEKPPRRYVTDSQPSWGLNSGKSTSVSISYEGRRRPRISEWRPKPRRPQSRGEETRAMSEDMDELVTQLEDLHIESVPLTDSNAQAASEDFLKVVARKVDAES